MRACFGIDLGTSNSSIAYIVDDPRWRTAPVQQVKVVPIDEHTLRLPSVVGRLPNRKGETEALVGWQFLREFFKAGSRTRRKPLRQGRNLFRSSKSEIGTHRLYDLSEVPDCHTPKDVARKIIETLVEAVERHNDRLDVCSSSVVVTVPASFSQIARTETLDAAHQAGLLDVRLLDEPVAALLDFLNDPAAAELFEDEEPKNVLVFDYGGGTCDLSLVRVRLNRSSGIGLETQNLAVSNYLQLGGDDVDRAIMSEVVWPWVLQQQGLESLDSLGLQARRQVEDTLAISLARALKERMCVLLRDRDELPLTYGGVSVTQALEIELNVDTLPKTVRGTCTLDALDFERVMARFTRDPREFEEWEVSRHSLLAPIFEVLQKAKMSPEDLDALLLHGGACKNPLVKRLMSGFFSRPGDLFANTKVFQTPDLDTSVAKGAALECYWRTVRDQQLVRPVMPEDVGILAKDDQPVPILKAGTPVPYPDEGTVVTVEEEFFTQRANQDEILIPLYTRTPDRLAGRVKMPLPPNTPAGATVRLKFSIDSDKRLHWWWQLGKGDDWAAEVFSEPWTMRLPSHALERLNEHRKHMAEVFERNGVLDDDDVDTELRLMYRAADSSDEYEALLLRLEDLEDRVASDAHLLNLRSLTFQALDRERDALAPAREAVRLMPENPVLHGNLGILLQHGGRSDDAVLHLRKAAGSFSYAAEVLADIYLASGESEKALGVLQKGVVLAQREAHSGHEALWAELRLSRMYALLGDDQEADRARARARRIELDHRLGGDSRNQIASKDSGMFMPEESEE